MVFRKICPPALIYLVFSITQVGIDTFRGMYNMALVKMWVALIFTILLNFLCEHGLGVISWIIVFVPFILMTMIVSMLLVMFGLNPSTGKMQSYTPQKKPKRHYYESGSYYDDYSGKSKGGDYSGGSNYSQDSPMTQYDERQQKAYNERGREHRGREHRGRDYRGREHRGREHRGRDYRAQSRDSKRDRPENHNHRHHQRRYNDEQLSRPQKHVLNDMVQQRTGLSIDPLQRS